MFIIGEAGSNYNGSFEQAKNLIKIAHDSGVDSYQISNDLYG